MMFLAATRCGRWRMPFAPVPQRCSAAPNGVSLEHADPVRWLVNRERQNSVEDDVEVLCDFWSWCLTGERHE